MLDDQQRDFCTITDKRSAEAGQLGLQVSPIAKSNELSYTKSLIKT